MQLWETSHQMARKLRWYIKQHANSAVQTLLVPHTNEDGTTTWETVTDTDDIYRLLIKWNTHKLNMSNKSPFATGPIADDIGPYGDNDIVDHILDATITFDSLGLRPKNVDKELTTLLKCFQRANTTNGTPIKDMEGTISLTDYTSLFKKTKESTSSSPLP